MAPSLHSFQSAISILTVPIYFLVAFVLYRRGLFGSYRFFSIGACLEGLFLALSLVFTSRQASISIYLTDQAVLSIFYVLMVIEVFRKVFIGYPGIARFAQRIIIASMVIAFVVAIASTGGDSATPLAATSKVQFFSVGFRATTSALVLYLLLISAFLIWMPVPLPQNTIRHSFLFFFYFITTTSVYYTLNIVGKAFLQRANLVLSILTLLSLICWLFLLKPGGEQRPKGPAKPKSSAGAIMSRLESINKSLSPPEE